MLDTDPRRLAALTCSGSIGFERRANLVLRLVDRLERACRQKCENRGTNSRHLAARHQHRTPQHIRIDLIEHRIVLRNAAAVDHAQRRRAIFAHAIENHAGVKRRSFDGREQFVLRGAAADSIQS